MLNRIGFTLAFLTVAFALACSSTPETTASIDQTQRTLEAPPPLIEDDQYEELLQRIAAEAFPPDKLVVIEDATEQYSFHAEHIAGLFGLVTMVNDQVEMVRMTAHRILDLENEELILDQFSFDQPREEASEILAEHK